MEVDLENVQTLLKMVFPVLGWRCKELLPILKYPVCYSREIEGRNDDVDECV